MKENVIGFAVNAWSNKFIIMDNKGQIIFWYKINF